MVRSVFYFWMLKIWVHLIFTCLKIFFFLGCFFQGFKHATALFSEGMKMAEGRPGPPYPTRQNLVGGRRHPPCFTDEETEAR